MDNGASSPENGQPTGPDSLEIMSELISLSCITIMAAALGSKTKRERLVNLTYGRTLVLAVYVLSWAFSVTSMVSVSTNNFNMTSCTLAMMACDVFYAGSKIVIYAWLIERVHLVTAVRTTRLKSWQYRFHMVLLMPYIGIFVLMLTFRNIYLLDTGECIIGLKWIASMPLMFYDFFLNLYLTYLFIRPLLNVGRTTGRTEWKDTRLYRLTKRTLVASCVCLLVSLANVLVVVITVGHMRGLVCLTCCTLDVTINVITIHWVTSTSSKMSARHTGTLNSDEMNRNTGSGTPAHVSHEMTVDSTLDYYPHEKYNFPDLPTTIHEERQRDIDEDSMSIRSIQVSQSSVKPLHEPSL
ncbi:hypothetical protein BJV82DRAFT_629276 [Fennellomyces sp. T-0311]|nr:hypothetical protein BJV82DRAFT_629276 [Fennellomyces sp. T-0311]